MTQINLNVDVHHLTRVEGHGNIHVKVENGALKEARWEVIETPRFFEVMLKGKHYTSAGILTARICGICSIGHCLASVRATENAFGVTIPDAAAKLRLLAKHGETLQSHALHLFFLAAPDFLGLESALPLLELKPEVVVMAARIKGLANRISDAVAGRTTHPVSIQVGGMAAMPDKRKLEGFRAELEGILNDFIVTASLFGTFKIPDFARETEFVSLKGERSYPWIGGDLVSTDGVVKREADYLAMTNEYVVDGQTTKWCKLSRPSLAVGALARVNNNYAFLHPDAKKVADGFGLAPVNHNPFMHNVAQLVEAVHVTHEMMLLIDQILGWPESTELMTKVTPRAGEGVGAVEVPRGILYHHYAYDREGYVQKANCIIPTTQNNKNIADDMPALVTQFATTDMTDAKLEVLCSMLVRAYDPCISCSVH
ncbi:MAG TPA: Ni/Fe hydrogenase subunit alpha [Polyangia bacterium]|jgi:coenzyme F420-reducing hydrogenase alpha subunit